MYDVGSDRERDASCCRWHDLDTRRYPPHGLRQALCGSGAGPKHKTDVQKACCIPENPRCGRDSVNYDPNLPDMKTPRKVIRGGSHLCAPELLLGFRCVVRNSGGMTPQTPY